MTSGFVKDYIYVKQACDDEGHTDTGQLTAGTG